MTIEDKVMAYSDEAFLLRARILKLRWIGADEEAERLLQRMRDGASLLHLNQPPASALHAVVDTD